MKRSVLKATALVFVLSLAAKIIGFVKSIVQASYFGTTIGTDAFNVASGFVSNVLYMFATALAVAFVPLYIQRKLKKDEKQFATRTITALVLLSIGITIVLILCAPWIVKLIAPSYTGKELALTIRFFRVLVLGFTFALTTHLYTNLLNAEKVYGFSTFCAIINSVVLIAFIILFSESWGVWALVISMPVSFFLQWLLLYLKGKKYAKISFRYGIWERGIKVLAVQAFPILISQATVEINQVVDRALLTSVGTGALTAVAYSAVLYQFVTSLVSAPLSTVMFTELSEAGALNYYDGIKNVLNNCYKLLLLVCVPIVLIMFFIPNDIVSIVYGHGRFDSAAVANCALGLKMYGLCLLPVCIKTVLSRAYYAINNTRRPMVIGVLEVALNIGLSILLVRYYGILGVVGATAIASFVFIIVMLIDYNYKYIKVLSKQTILQYWKIGVATIILIAAMILLKNVFFYNSLINFILQSVIAFLVYWAILLVLKENSLIRAFKKGILFIKNKGKKSS